MDAKSRGSSLMRDELFPVSNDLPTNDLLPKGKSNLTVEKPGRYHLKQVSKLMSTIMKTQHHMPPTVKLRAHSAYVVFLPKMHSVTLITRKQTSPD